MSQILKRDLFSPPEVKKRPPRGPSMRKMSIPQEKNWHKVHGSWAVMKGIVKLNNYGG